jgi:cytidylate kinase
VVIAIDGPAGAGKSSVARGVAAVLGFTYLDSGAMYRCVALAALAGGMDLDDADALGELARDIRIELGDGRVQLDGDDVSAAIRAPAVTEAASRVSVHPPVREALVAAQRRLVAEGRYVAEGRDIGTVVSPDAPLKVFLTASEEERAARRAAQTGEDPAAVLAAQRERDRRDTTREHSALRPAPDAVEVDTSDLSLSEAIERVAALAAERGLASAGRG